MRSFLVWLRKMAPAFVLCAIVLMPLGCSFNRLGETTAQGHRRHLRNYRLNQGELMHDIDMVLMTEEPSRLGEMRIP